MRGEIAPDQMSVLPSTSNQGTPMAGQIVDVELVRRHRFDGRDVELDRLGGRRNSGN